MFKLQYYLPVLAPKTIPVEVWTFEYFTYRPTLWPRGHTMTRKQIRTDLSSTTDHRHHIAFRVRRIRRRLSGGFHVYSTCARFSYYTEVIKNIGDAKRLSRKTAFLFTFERRHKSFNNPTTWGVFAMFISLGPLSVITIVIIVAVRYRCKIERNTVQ